MAAAHPRRPPSELHAKKSSPAPGELQPKNRARLGLGFRFLQCGPHTIGTRRLGCAPWRAKSASKFRRPAARRGQARHAKIERIRAPNRSRTSSSLSPSGVAAPIARISIPREAKRAPGRRATARRTKGGGGGGSPQEPPNGRRRAQAQGMGLWIVGGKKSHSGLLIVPCRAELLAAAPAAWGKGARCWRCLKKGAPPGQAVSLGRDEDRQDAGHLPCRAQLRA